MRDDSGSRTEVSLKYAVVERERRFVIAELPAGVVESRVIVDRYLTGTRLRLREVTHPDGRVVRKLTQKVRFAEGPAEIACTNLYLDEAEWAMLGSTPGRTLRKTRHLVVREGYAFAVDELEDGRLIAEFDDGDATPPPVPSWLQVIADVSSDERWTGAALAT